LAAPLRELLSYWLELRRDTERCTTVFFAPLSSGYSRLDRVDQPAKQRPAFLK
jgi:hypothetical protein